LVKKVTTTHSILLCALLAPLGYLAHIITCFVCNSASGGSMVPPAVPASSLPSLHLVEPTSSSSHHRNGTDNSGEAGHAGAVGRFSQAAQPASGAWPSVSGATSEGAGEMGRTAAIQTMEPVVSRIDAQMHSDRAGEDKNRNNRSVGAGQPRKGWGGLGGRRHPSWLTVMEPVYISRSRQSSEEQR
jgi:hypothetical protein